MNDLIAEPANPTAWDCAEGLRVIGPGLVAKNGLEDGSLLTASLAGASFFTDAAEAIVDPLASMAASAASFLMEFCGPLREALDSLTGSPAAVSAQAQTWSAIAQRVEQTSDDYASRTNNALSSWSGPAALAYQAFAGTYSQILDGVGALCSGVSGSMVRASGVVGFVRTIVRETIADLVGKLISWVAKVTITGGLGATWVIPEATGAIALYVNKVRGWLISLAKFIKRVSEAVKSMNDSLDMVIPVLGRIREKVDVPLFPLQSTRARNRGMPNLKDFVPNSITGTTNALNSGMSTAARASQEPE